MTHLSKTIKIAMVTAIAVGMIFFTGPGRSRHGEISLDEYSHAVAAVGPKMVPREIFAQALAAYFEGNYVKAYVFFEILGEKLTGRDKPTELVFWRAESAFRVGRTDQARTGFQTYLQTAGQGGRGATAAARLSAMGR